MEHGVEVLYMGMGAVLFISAIALLLSLDMVFNKGYHAAMNNKAQEEICWWNEE